MKLNAEDLAVLVSQSHDETIIGPGGLVEGIWQRETDYERVIPNHLDALRYSLKQIQTVMNNVNGKAMHWLRSQRDATSKDSTDTLMPQANAKDRLWAIKKHVTTDSKILRVRWTAGTGGYHNAVHTQFTKGCIAHLVIPEY